MLGGLQFTGWLGWLDLAVRIALVLWMARIAVLDHRDGQIPNRLTAPIFLGLGLFQILYAVIVLRGNGEAWLGRPVFIVVSFAVTFGLWMLHFIGGGDAKFLMALFALFPSMEFVVVLALLLLIITLPLALWELRGQRPGDLLRGMRARLLTGEVLPTEQELQERGRRYAWTFAIPGAVYAMLYWQDGFGAYARSISTYMQGIL